MASLLQDTADLVPLGDQELQDKHTETVEKEMNYIKESL